MDNLWSSADRTYDLEVEEASVQRPNNLWKNSPVVGNRLWISFYEKSSGSGGRVPGVTTVIH